MKRLGFILMLALALFGGTTVAAHADEATGIDSYQAP